MAGRLRLALLLLLWPTLTYAQTDRVVITDEINNAVVVSTAGGALQVSCVGGTCTGGGGTTEVDDNSIASGQTLPISIILPYYFDGANWVRWDRSVTGSGNFNVVGTKSSNGGVPGATNLGILPAIATAADPTYTEGNQVAASTTLAGYTRVTCNNCGGGTTDTDDGSVAGGQTGGLMIGLTHVWNGANWQRMVAAALGDATANPTVASFGSFPHTWNGATWDRWAGEIRPRFCLDGGPCAADGFVTGNGVTTTFGGPGATIRVTLANDSTGRLRIWDGTDTLNITGTSADVNVAQFGGTAVVTGTGASGLGIPRITVSNDSAIANTAFGITQTGSNNDVDVLSLPALPAGTNAIGVVSTKTALTFNAPASASVGVASGQVLAANASRKGAVFVNTSNNTISCSVAQTAVLNAGVTLWPGGSWSMNEYTFATGAVNCIASAASSNLSIQELQ